MARRLLDNTEENVAETVAAVPVEDLEKAANRERARAARAKPIEIVNVSMRPNIIRPPSDNGKGTRKTWVLPYQKATVPEAFFEQLKRHWVRRPGERFNPVTYKEPNFDRAPVAGNTTESFTDRATKRTFKTCKQIGTVEMGTAQAGLCTSVFQAQSLLARLPDTEHIKEYLSIDMRPLVAVYGMFVLQRREAEEAQMTGRHTNPSPRVAALGSAA